MNTDPASTCAPENGVPAFLAAPAAPAVVTLTNMIDAYFQDYEVRQFTIQIARVRVAHLRRHFGAERPAADITTFTIRHYQLARRQQGAASATINRETSALNRMIRIVVQWGWLPQAPVFPGRLRENQPRQGFFEHADYLAVRSYLPPGFQDVLDFAYYSGWRKREIVELMWNEVDFAGGVNEREVFAAGQQLVDYLTPGHAQPHRRARTSERRTRWRRSRTKSTRRDSACVTL